jgi:large subunit ribosomal protein L30
MKLLSNAELNWIKYSTDSPCQDILYLRVIMSRVRITQVKSTIDRPEKQKLTIKALGLGKLNRSVEKENTEAIAGMIRKVNHLVIVEEI